jgi:hypothetical protein
MADAYKINVLLRSRSHAITSPTFKDEQHAQDDLRALRQARSDGRALKLEWFSVLGSDILAAFLVDVSDPAPFRHELGQTEAL